jgi:hypothetical protein
MQERMTGSDFVVLRNYAEARFLSFQLGVNCGEFCGLRVCFGHKFVQPLF